MQYAVIPFIRYVTRFIKSNGMKIKQLFINGHVQDVLCRKQFGIVKQNHEIPFIPNILQRDRAEFYEMANSFGYIFPNCLSQPVFNRLRALPVRDYCEVSDTFSQETFKSLFEACPDVKVMSISNMLTRHFIPFLYQAKIVVLINCLLLEKFGEGDIEVKEAKFDYCFYNAKNTYYNIKKEFWPTDTSFRLKMSLSGLLSYSYSPLVKLYESMDIHIIPESDYYYNSNVQPIGKKVVKAMDDICEILSESTTLKTVTLQMSFQSALIEPVPMKYNFTNSVVEHLHLRMMHKIISKLNFHSFISQFKNLKIINLETVHSDDCNTLREVLEEMPDLEVARISFYSTSIEDSESKYFNFIASMLQNHKKLTRFEFEFPNMDSFTGESDLISSLGHSNCNIVLKRLPFLSSETLTTLKNIPLLRFSTKPKLLSELPEIDYDQDIDSILHKKRDFRQQVQHCLITCPDCLAILPRHCIGEHFKKHHTGFDIEKDSTDIHNYNVICQCCKGEYSKREIYQHLDVCENANYKFQLPIVEKQSKKLERFHFLRNF